MHRLPVLLLFIAPLACSSGGGDGDDSKGAVSTIAGPGVTQGTITGFGSRVVGGTRWTIPGATIVMDGEPDLLEEDLLRGMVVTIEGGRSEDATTGTATRVEYDDAIEGPIHEVSIVDANTKRLTMLGDGGQTVLVRREETLFSRTAFSTLFPSNVVEVSGIVDDNDEIEATLIVHLDDRPVLGVSGSPVELKGEITTVNIIANPKWFLLDSIVTVFYDATTDTSGVPGGIDVGKYVEAKGVFIGSNGVGAHDAVCAVGDTCEIALVEDPLPDDMENVDLEGFVTASKNQNEFEVDGRSVDASGPSVSRDPTESNFIAVGARIAVEGNLVGGTLIAETVRNRSADVRIEGTLAQTSDRNVAAGTIELGTDTIRVDASTVMNDEQGSNEDFDLGDIVAGDDLVIIGTNLNNSIRATHLTRKDP